MAIDTNFIGVTEGRTHIILPMADPMVRRMVFIYSCLISDDNIKRFIASLLARYQPKVAEEVIDGQRVFQSENMDLVTDVGTGLIGFLN